MLALLITAATGAWAQDAPTPELLTTIVASENSSFTSGSKTFDNKATVTLSGTVTNSDAWNNANAGDITLTVTGAKGYTVTSCTFFHTHNTLSNSVQGASPTVYLNENHVCRGPNQDEFFGMGGVTKIEVYGYVTPPGKYNVKMGAGTDADNWTARAGGSGEFTALPLKDVTAGTKPLELKYAGSQLVKRVTATVTPKWAGDLSKILAADLDEDGVTLVVTDGMTLTGTLAENYKLVIADGATVTLNGVTISGANDNNYAWAGITCAGDATIILADGTENTVKGFYEEFPGIYVPNFKVLDIKGGSAGTGKLTASSNGNAAGIGGGKALACGSIAIIGVNVTATGGGKAAGIGGGEAAGCGFISILDGVTPVKVKAMKGAEAPNSIGAGFGGTCGAVNIGNTIYNDGDTYLAQAKIVYPSGGTIDLTNVGPSDLQDDDETFIVADGATLTGTLNGETQEYKISIEDGAEVTLDGVTINGYNHSAYLWAGLHCLGDATIILKDGTANSVTGFADEYPGIYVPTGKTLTIKGESLGTGSLSASSNGNAAGIGGGFTHSCGNITIEGGIITAQGGDKAAGIGSGSAAKCGNILITGGTITATGGQQAAGIGGGRSEVNPTGCGNITITDGVTLVTATKGEGAPYSIGMGASSGSPNSCGTVTIGGTVYWENGAAVNGDDTYLAQATIVYPVIVNPVVGQIIGSDGKNYDANATLPTGVTKVAMIAYVGSETYDATFKNGLAIALADESGTMKWSTAKSTCEGKTAITGAKWCLPSQNQWKQMFKANGGNVGSYTGLNTTITNAGGTILQERANYWSSSEYDPGVRAYYVRLNSGAASWNYDYEDDVFSQVRACLAF